MAMMHRLTATATPTGAAFREKLLFAVSLTLLSVAASAQAQAPATPLETRPPNGSAQKPAFPGQTRAPALPPTPVEVTPVASGLDQPWAFEFLPDGRILVSEKPGQLLILGKDGKSSVPVAGLPAVAVIGQGGLLDVALDLHYQTNHTIYWSYAEDRGQDTNGTTLAKGVLDSGDHPNLSHVQVIFRQVPALNSRLHFGSRIVLNGDGTLFLTLGERSIPEGRAQAQNLGSLLGKLVRIKTDGSIPADNPFISRKDVRPEIWSYGHRNVQAAALDPEGHLWTVEHGARGGDELNQPRPGLNYGWPVITYGIEYQGGPIGDGLTAQAGMEQPVYYWDPVIAPSSMAFYTGDLFPSWRGSLLIGGLAGNKLVRLQLRKNKVVGEEWLLQGHRIRDVKQGPDGAVYVITDGPDAELLKLTPRKPQ